MVTVIVGETPQATQPETQSVKVLRVEVNLIWSVDWEC